MNEKLQKVLEDVLQDEAKASEFAKLQTVDEMYAYFAKKIPGLSESEFDSFIVEMMDGYAESESAIQDVDVASLKEIAGGANLRTKIASGALAVLSLLPAVGASASAAKAKKPHAKPVISKKIPTPKVVKPAAPVAPAPASVSPAVEAPVSSNIPEPSNKFPASKSWFRRHPVKATLGAIGTAILAYFVAKKMDWIGKSASETIGLPAPEEPLLLQAPDVKNLYDEFISAAQHNDFDKARETYNILKKQVKDLTQNQKKRFKAISKTIPGI